MNHPAPEKCCPRCLSTQRDRVVSRYQGNAWGGCTQEEHDPWHGVLPVEPQATEKCKCGHSFADHSVVRSKGRYCFMIDCLCAKFSAVETVPVVPPDSALRAAHAIQSEIAPVDLMWGSDEVAEKIAGIIQREISSGVVPQGAPIVAVRFPGEKPLRDPTAEELESPLFNAIWKAIKGWDIRRENAIGYAGATGTDVCTILDAMAHAAASPAENAELKAKLDAANKELACRPARREGSAQGG